MFPVSVPHTILSIQIQDTVTTDLEHFIIEDGQFKGRGAYKFFGNNDDKTQNLSLDQPVLRDNSDLSRVIDNPDDEWCTYRLLKYLLEVYLPPEWNGPLFLYPAPDTDLIKRQIKNDPCLANFKLAPSCKGKIRPIGVLGKNASTALCREIAYRSKFTKPERFTGRGPRRTAITNMHRNGGDPATILKKARHSSMEMSMVYTEVERSQIDKTLASLHYKPERKDDDAKPAAVDDADSKPAAAPSGSFSDMEESAKKKKKREKKRSKEKKKAKKAKKKHKKNKYKSDQQSYPPFPFAQQQHAAAMPPYQQPHQQPQMYQGPPLPPYFHPPFPQFQQYNPYQHHQPMVMAPMFHSSTNDTDTSSSDDS